jgi:hypothetical protein
VTSKCRFNANMKAITIYKLGFIILGMVTAGFLLGMPLQAEAQVPFTISGSFLVSSGVGAVATGDFNNDGKLDLVVASRESNEVSLFLGNGSGSFGASSPFSVGDEPFDLTTGDFDKDGNLDLAVANGGALEETVSILLGTGTGSFQQPRADYTVGSRPMSVAAGYLNNDEILDLATANFASADVSILLGTGNGAFAAATNIPVGTLLSNPRSVEMGDLDGDGNLDLSVAEASDNTVSILWGDGDGSFGSTTYFAAGAVPVSLALGDVNGDGYPDIAVANNSTNYVTILFGDINGSFAVSSTTPAGQYPLSVSMSDFDGDGNLDLLVGTQVNGDIGSNSISLLLGDGTGAFGSPDTIFSLAIPTGDIHDPYTAIGDFNGDQKPDIAVADTSADRVVILLNNPIRAMPWIPLLLLGD